MAWEGLGDGEEDILSPAGKFFVVSLLAGTRDDDMWGSIGGGGTIGGPTWGSGCGTMTGARQRVVDWRMLGACSPCLTGLALGGLSDVLVYINPISDAGAAREKSNGHCGPHPEHGKLLEEICGLRIAPLDCGIALLALARRGLLFCCVQKQLEMWLGEEEGG